MLVADLQPLNIMEAAAAAQWIHVVGRETEEENIKRIVKKKQNKTGQTERREYCPGLKITTSPYGRFPLFLKVDVKGEIINKGSKLGDRDRVGMGNTGIQVIKCTLKGQTTPNFKNAKTSQTSLFVRLEGNKPNIFKPFAGI